MPIPKGKSIDGEYLFNQLKNFDEKILKNKYKDIIHIKQVEELPTTDIAEFPTLYALKAGDNKYTLHAYDGENWSDYGGSGGSAGVSIARTLKKGATDVVITNDAITEDCTITLFADKFGVSPTSMSVSGKTLTIKFPAQDAAMKIKVVLGDTTGGDEPEPEVYSSLTVTVNNDDYYGKDVTISNSDDIITKPFGSNGVVVFPKLSYLGTYTITCEDLSDSVNNEEAGSELMVEFDVPKPEPVTLKAFSECTDEDIVGITTAYYNGDLSLDEIKAVWRVGDKRKFHLNAMSATGVGESHHADDYDFVILGFDHDTLTTPINGKTKALLSVQTDRILTTAGRQYQYMNSAFDAECGYINSTNTNAGGWKDSARRTWCNSVFKNSLSSSIQGVMKSVSKKTSAGNKSTTINTTDDYVYFLSEVEIFGTTTWSFAGEGSHYDYYKDVNTNHYKLPAYNESYPSALWWERSPRSSSSTGFCYVVIGGSAGYSGANGTYGLAPAFSI